MENEIDQLEEYMDKLHKSLSKARFQKTKNGFILNTPLFGRFENCLCIRGRSHHGRRLGIVVDERLKKRFETVEMRLQEFASLQKNIPANSDEIKIIKNGIVWSDIGGRIPKEFIADVTIRFHRIFFGERIVVRSEVVGVTYDGNEEFMNSEEGLAYLMNFYRIL